MSEPFLGEVRLVGFNFAPQGWLLAAGQLLPIQQYAALFSLLGIQYGGNGTSNFALPDLRGRVPVSQGTGIGLSTYVIGETVGVESVQLNISEMPAHNHLVNANTARANQPNPIGHYPATDAAGATAEYSATASGQMNPSMLTQTGQGLPHENRQPTVVLNWIIATSGIFPTRN